MSWQEREYANWDVDLRPVYNNNERVCVRIEVKSHLLESSLKVVSPGGKHEEEKTWE